MLKYINKRIQTVRYIFLICNVDMTIIVVVHDMYYTMNLKNIHALLNVYVYFFNTVLQIIYFTPFDKVFTLI